MSNPGTLLIFGASRGAGLETARLARSHGWNVHALVRTASPTLEALDVQQHVGDALDATRVAEVCAACSDADAVISTMSGGPVGASADFIGVANAVEGARAAGIERFLLVSSLGAGESRAHASERLLQAIGHILEEKTRGEECLLASGLRHTVIRPGRLVDESQPGGGALVEDPGVHGDLGRGDLAELLLACIKAPQTEGRIFSSVGRGFLSTTANPMPKLLPS